jgi:hypothetical protein
MKNLMDRLSSMIRLIRSWKMPHQTVEKRRPTRLLIPRICNQDGVLPVLLALKSVSFNDYDLRKCGKRSERSGGMNCSTRSSLWPCQSMSGSKRRHPKSRRSSQLLPVRPQLQAVRPPPIQYLAVQLHILVVRPPRRRYPKA